MLVLCYKYVQQSCAARDGARGARPLGVCAGTVGERRRDGGLGVLYYVAERDGVGADEVGVVGVEDDLRRAGGGRLGAGGGRGARPRGDAGGMAVPAGRGEEGRDPACLFGPSRSMSHTSKASICSSLGR